MENLKESMEITLGDIRQMVLECVGKIMEVTNMKTLYHFTSLQNFENIVKTNRLKAATYVKEYWGNNPHISFTRHRSNLEGFANARCIAVRMQFNIDKLSSSHDIIDINPMEFYSPQRYGKFFASYGSSKAFYQNPEHRENSGVEFHNQAEEGVQTKEYGIVNLDRYVDRVDILFNNIDKVYNNSEKWDDICRLFKRISKTAFSNLVPIFVYLDRSHFMVQDNECITFKDFVKHINRLKSGMRKGEDVMVKTV